MEDAEAFILLFCSFVFFPICVFFFDILIIDYFVFASFFPFWVFFVGFFSTSFFWLFYRATPITWTDPDAPGQERCGWTRILCFPSNSLISLSYSTVAFSTNSFGIFNVTYLECWSKLDSLFNNSCYVDQQQRIDVIFNCCWKMLKIIFYFCIYQTTYS